MQLIVFVKDEHKLNVTNIEYKQENTGFLSILPNKGGLRISFNIYGTYVTFISCHLAAHEGYKKCHIRNESTVEILGGLRLGDKKDYDISSLSHHTIWMGDMNYRVTFGKKTPADIDRKSKDEIIKLETPEIKGSPMEDENQNDEEEDEDDEFIMSGKLATLQNTTPKEVVSITDHNKISSLITNRNWSSILELDELNREIKGGRALCDFTPLTPTFPPTFKRIRQSAIESSTTTNIENPLLYYNKKRLPSYTDRILYKSLPGFKKNLIVTGFESVEQIQSSDHKPVR